MVRLLAGIVASWVVAQPALASGHWWSSHKTTTTSWHKPGPTSGPEPHGNTSYENPVLSGFHPDPSCVFVPELDNTAFCASSSFLAFPSIPIHASKDFVNWKLIGHALSRPSQWSDFGNTTLQLGGMFAPTLRYHNGRFYVVAAYAAIDQLKLFSLIFNTTDIYAPNAWGNPVFFNGSAIDPSIIWDNNGTTYVEVAGIQQDSIDLTTGEVGSAFVSIWNGTGGSSPEGPHMYFKDGYYYLMIAEGGTELHHMETIARSKNIGGPFESYAKNPILTNANTTQYFQTVGHADLFQDGAGNWWGVALSTRCGPEYYNYPMGRETVLYPVTWDEGQWPVLQPVRGKMSGPLPPKNLNVPGTGAFNLDPDFVNFEAGVPLPSHFTYWRYPKPNAYAISPPGHPNTLRLTPSYLNLTAYDGYSPLDGQTFVSRRQVHSLFTFSVDVDFLPTVAEQEAGVSAFLKQEQHLDLGIVLLSPDNVTAPTRHLRLRATNDTLYVSEEVLELLAEGGAGAASQLGSLLKRDTDSQNMRSLLKRDSTSTNDTATVIVPVPASWGNNPIRLQIQAETSTEFTFSASPAPFYNDTITLGKYTAALISGGFTGTLLGSYATTNGGGINGTEAYLSNWRYIGQGQVIS